MGTPLNQKKDSNESVPKSEISTDSGDLLWLHDDFSGQYWKRKTCDTASLYVMAKIMQQKVTKCFLKYQHQMGHCSTRSTSERYSEMATYWEMVVFYAQWNTYCFNCQAPEVLNGLTCLSDMSLNLYAHDILLLCKVTLLFEYHATVCKISKIQWGFLQEREIILRKTNKIWIQFSSHCWHFKNAS